MGKLLFCSSGGTKFIIRSVSSHLFLCTFSICAIKNKHGISHKAEVEKLVYQQKQNVTKCNGNGLSEWMMTYMNHVTESEENICVEDEEAVTLTSKIQKFHISIMFSTWFSIVWTLTEALLMTSSRRVLFFCGALIGSDWRISSACCLFQQTNSS